MMDKQKQVAVRKSAGQEGAFVDMLNQEMKELQDGLKQKQIEEIARNLGDGKGYACSCDTDCCEECILKRDCVPYSCAEVAYNAGYRKIPEGAVVLTREEYETLKCDLDKYDYGDFENGYSQGYKQGSKETAEKFAERVKMAFYYEFDELIPSIMADKIDVICNEIIGDEK